MMKHLVTSEDEPNPSDKIVMIEDLIETVEE
jgi:hypothetical protein